MLSGLGETRRQLFFALWQEMCTVPQMIPRLQMIPAAVGLHYFESSIFIACV